jgi:hypothetical protein
MALDANQRTMEQVNGLPANVLLRRPDRLESAVAAAVPSGKRNLAMFRQAVAADTADSGWFQEAVRASRVPGMLREMKGGDAARDQTPLARLKRRGRVSARGDGWRRVI